MLIRPAALAALFVAFSSHAQLPDGVRDRLKGAGIPEEAMGAIVIRVPDGAKIVDHRSGASMAPASTLKLLTSLAALEKLGPAWRAKTELRSSAPVVDGVLRGDLVLKGGGDVDFDWRALERMLSSLRLQGIREIEGDLVLDLSHFRPARTDIGLAPFDEAPEFRYNVVPDALLLNTYLVNVDMASGAGGIRVSYAPALKDVSFVAEMALVQRDCDDWEDGWKLPAIDARGGAIQVRLRGEFPRDCQASTAINVLDRVVFADRLFRNLWTGGYRGRTREGMAPAGSRVLAEHFSRPLAEIVRDVNKRSDNPITRVLYLSLGAQSNADAKLPTARRAETEVRSWLASHGIEADGLVLENGSGLSRTERIRPAQLAAVLKAALASRWSPEFLASLPIVAVDGAMRQRLAESPAAAHGRIKTGTLRDVSAVAGYVEDSRGKTCIVVAMINHELADRKVARPILDALLDWVARRP